MVMESMTPAFSRYLRNSSFFASGVCGVGKAASRRGWSHAEACQRFLLVGRLAPAACAPATASLTWYDVAMVTRPRSCVGGGAECGTTGGEAKKRRIQFKGDLQHN